MQVFKDVGNRESYSFNLQLANGHATNNIKGSAVARDLAFTIANSLEAKKLLYNKDVKINMDNTFRLHIRQLS